MSRSSPLRRLSFSTTTPVYGSSTSARILLPFGPHGPRYPDSAASGPRPPDRQFKAFTTHLLDQHAQLKFATPGYLERIRLIGVLSSP